MVTDNQKLVSDKIPTFFKKYKNVNFVIYSSSLKNNIDVHINLLGKNNVTIKNHYKLPNFDVDEFNEYLAGRSIYKNGVILTNKEEKGAVLKSFLKRLPQKPTLSSSSSIIYYKNAIVSLPETKLIVVEYL